MRIIVIGCGTLGACLVAELAVAGHEIVAVDQEQDALDALPAGRASAVVRAQAHDVDALARAGAHRADVGVVVMGSDERNLTVAALLRTVIGLERVVARVRDPDRIDTGRTLGVEPVCPTLLAAGEIRALVDRPPGPAPARTEERPA